MRRSLVLCLVVAAAGTARANGHDFADDARYIHRVLACGDTAIPPRVNQRTLARHCKQLRRLYTDFRKRYTDRAQPFLSRLRPAKLPKEVVYPFGGGDLLAPLAAFPDAGVITTISLESSGDPRRFRLLRYGHLEQKRRTYRTVMGALLRVAQSRNNGLKTFEIGPIPGQLAFSLGAAAAYGYEPVSLRYFTIEPGGTLRYYTLDGIRGLERKKGGRLGPLWINTDFSVAFRHMEIRYRRTVPGRDTTELIHRHIAANLHDSRFRASALRKHLERKGRVAAMVKAASYLMWRPDFSAIRDYLLSHIDFMFADASAILPRHARAAGIEMTTYGEFIDPYLPRGGGAAGAEMRREFRTQSRRPIPFRYSWSDRRGRPHLIVYRPKSR